MHTLLFIIAWLLIGCISVFAALKKEIIFKDEPEYNYFCIFIIAFGFISFVMILLEGVGQDKKDNQ